MRRYGFAELREWIIGSKGKIRTWVAWNENKKEHPTAAVGESRSPEIPHSSKIEAEEFSAVPAETKGDMWEAWEDFVESLKTPNNVPDNKKRTETQLQLCHADLPTSLTETK